MENNLFLECPRAFHLDARGQGWLSYLFDGTDSLLLDRCRAVGYDRPPYSIRYPALAHLFQEDPQIPKGNMFRTNIAARCANPVLLEGVPDGLVRVENNLFTDNQAITAPGDGGFRLDPGSESLPAGFQPLPERFGLFLDRFRKTLPLPR